MVAGSKGIGDPLVFSHMVPRPLHGFSVGEIGHRVIPVEARGAVGHIRPHAGMATRANKTISTELSMFFILFITTLLCKGER